MTGLLTAITPRDVPARVRASCSDVSFAARIAYEADPDGRSPLQRRIEGALRLPARGWMVSAGGVEFWFDDRLRLSAIDLYAAFAAAPEAELPPVLAPPAWLALPGFDIAADDRFSVAVAWRVSIDRRRRAVRLASATAGEPTVSYALADKLIVRVDAGQCLVDLAAYGLDWQNSDPVR